MSESMFVAHFFLAHSCCFLGATYYAISALHSNPRFQSQKFIPIADFTFVFAFTKLQ